MKNIDKMRPSDMHKKALLLREKSGVEFFLNKKENFIDVHCPACLSSENSIDKFEKYGFNHKYCQYCMTLYVSPRPIEKDLFEFYDNYEAPKYWTELLVKTNNERKFLQHMPRVKMLSAILKNSNNDRNILVDLGAGNGNFSKAIQESNLFKKVIATDINDECIASCKNQGLNTKKATIIDFEDSSIDCLSFNDLIEHVFSPHIFLEDCFKKLKKNGILMLSTPNGEGFDFKILKENTENITPPEHIQYFNPKSIKILLKKIGFNNINVSTPGILDISIIKRQVEEKNLDLTKNNEFLSYLYDLNNSELENSFQEFLQQFSLSSHMLVFAEK